MLTHSEPASQPVFVDVVALATAAGSCQTLGRCTVLEWCKESNGKKMQEQKSHKTSQGGESKRSQNFQYMKNV